MAYVKVRPPAEVYHLTKKEHLDSILDDGVIRRFDDTECWFCESLEKMKAYMAQTVLCEGKPYYAVGGQLCRYPKFVPEDYVLLKLTPCGYEDKWYRWEQEMPPGSPKALIRAAREFSALKIGYRGDLAFRNAEVINVPKFLTEGIVQSDSVQTTSRLRDMRSVDIGAVAAESLPDVSGMTFDNALSRKERISRFLQTVKNPYCFCIGGVGVKIEFAESGPSLQDKLTDFLLRQRSGL